MQRCAVQCGAAAIYLHLSKKKTKDLNDEPCIGELISRVEQRLNGMRGICAALYFQNMYIYITKNIFPYIILCYKFTKKLKCKYYDYMRSIQTRVERSYTLYYFKYKASKHPTYIYAVQII